MLAALLAIPNAATLTSHTSLLLEGMTSLELWYRLTDLRSHLDLYEALLQQLGENMDKQLCNNPNTDAFGILIKMCGWIKDCNYRLLLIAIKAFCVNMVLVLGHNQYYSMITTEHGKVVE